MHTISHALGAGAAAPENVDVLHRATGQDVWDQGNGNSFDSACTSAREQGANEKHFTTLQARAAIAGFELVRMADDSFVVARWTMTRALADVSAVDAFLAQVGAPR